LGPGLLQPCVVLSTTVHPSSAFQVVVVVEEEEIVMAVLVVLVLVVVVAAASTSAGTKTMPSSSANPSPCAWACAWD